MTTNTQPPAYTNRLTGLPTGRPSKLTPELQAEVCRLVREGNYISVALQAVGISNECLSEWKRRGELGDSPYHEFLIEWEKAQAGDEAERVSRIRQAGEHNWLADMTHLERRHPERWGRRDRLDVESHSTIDIQVNVSFGSLPQAANVQVEAIGTEVKELAPVESSTPPSENAQNDIVEASEGK